MRKLTQAGTKAHDMDGYRVHGTVGGPHDDDPGNPHRDLTYWRLDGREAWPDGELHHGVAGVEFRTWADDPTGGNLTVWGPDLDACVARWNTAAEALKAALEPMWKVAVPGPDDPYPYHTQRYMENGTPTELPCKHCRPGRPCPTVRGTFDPFPGTDARTFIQWKGTEVCLDFYCACGHHGHYDGGFAYYIRCPECEAVYEMGTQVKARRVGEHEDMSQHDPKVVDA